MKLAFLLGFLFGVVLSLAVILSGTVDVWGSTPLWQTILLFPGFFVGNGFDDCCGNWFHGDWRLEAAVVVGISAVGLWYGALACGIEALRRGLGSRRSPNAAASSG